MVTEHKGTIVEVRLILASACMHVCVFELSVNRVESAEAFSRGNKSTAEHASVAITLIAKRERKTTTSISLSLQSFPPLNSLFSCFL